MNDDSPPKGETQVRTTRRQSKADWMKIYPVIFMVLAQVKTPGQKAMHTSFQG